MSIHSQWTIWNWARNSTVPQRVKEALKVNWGHKGGPWSYRITVPMKRDSREPSLPPPSPSPSLSLCLSLPPPPGMHMLRIGCVGNTVRDSHLQPMGRALTRNWISWHLDLGLWPPELWENKFLLFKSPSLSYFVMAARADKHKDLILLRWQYFPNWSTDSMKPLSESQLASLKKLTSWF